MAYGALALLFIALWKEPPGTPSDMASWVQGVGTVMGVFAAIFAGFWPVEAARQAREKERLAFVTCIETSRMVVDAAVVPIRAGIEGRSVVDITGGLGVYQEIGPFDLLDGLLKEPQSQWPDPALYVFCLTYRKSLQKLEERIDRLSRPAGPDTVAGPLSWITPTEASPRMVAAAWKSLESRLIVVDMTGQGLTEAIALFKRGQR